MGKAWPTENPENSKVFQDITIKPPTDVVAFVPGTMDPINRDGRKHIANYKYFEHTKYNDIVQLLIKHKDEYNDLHVLSKFYSWSGDNNTDERIKAAKRLLKLLYKVYKPRESRVVHFHLIGHSHGGNVINEFTKMIASKKPISFEKEEYLFPEKWVIKSITYLSTPFFQEKHQLSHPKLHKKCKIISIYNKYDITQRFIADFSLYNLESIIEKVDKISIYRAWDRILLIINDNTYSQIFSIKSYINKEEGRLIWERTVKLFDNLLVIFHQIRDFVKSLKSTLYKEKKELRECLDTIVNYLSETKKTFDDNKMKRDGNYGLAEFIYDLTESETFDELLPALNNLIEIKTTAKTSKLLNILAGIFSEKRGLTESIDNTLHEPSKQVSDKLLKIVNISEEDPYHSNSNEKKFKGFADDLESSLSKGNLEEMLIILISQKLNSDYFKWASWFTTTIAKYQMKETKFKASWKDGITYEYTKLKKELDKITSYLAIYSKLVKKFNANLIKEEKEEIDTDIVFTVKSREKFTKEYIKIGNKEYLKDEHGNVTKLVKGSVEYFAQTSHSLSHNTSNWEKTWNNDVVPVLKSCFSSGKK